MKRMTAEQKFLKECNANRTLRVFGPDDYRAFKDSMRSGWRALHRCEPYYDSDHAGPFVHNCQSLTETAGWCVWVLHGEVYSEYGSFIYKPFVEFRYDPITYYKVWSRRHWHSPLFTIAPGLDAHIVAHWEVSAGRPFGRAKMSLVSPDEEKPLEVAAEIMEVLPRKLQRALNGTSWKWPGGVLEADCESIVRQRAEEIAELLPALAIITVSA